MEDYGWAFWVSHAKGAILVSLSYAHGGPVEAPAMWVITVEWQDSDLLRRWFRQPDESAFRTYADAVWSALQGETRIHFMGFDGA